MKQSIIHITLLTLILTYIFNVNRLVPNLIANSVLGIAYMLLEEESLIQTGVKSFGFHFNFDKLQLSVINLFTHLILPLYYIKFLQSPKVDSYYSEFLFAIMYMMTSDWDALYPRSRFPTSVYIASYFLVLIGIRMLFHTQTHPRLSSQ